MQQVAARHSAFQVMAGQQVGDDLARALLDGSTVIEQGEFHTFGIAIDGLAVGAVEGVEDLGVGLEVHGAVFDALGGHETFDDLAAHAVRRGIQGNTHIVVLHVESPLGGFRRYYGL